MPTLILVLSQMLLAGPVPRESPFVALRGATVHTFEPGDSPSVRTVLLENDRIVGVGADVVIPAGAAVVDLEGLHLMPGLVDGLVNFDAEHDALYLGAGVTLVRDVGNDLGRMTIERTREARERNPGPWIWSAGAVLDGAPPQTLNAIVLDSAQSAEDKLKVLFELEEPPNYLAFLPGLPRAAYAIALTKAHAERRQVWGTLPRGMKLEEALDAGQDGIFHLDSFLPPGKTWETVTTEDLAPAIELCVAKRIAVTPTLALWGRALVAPKEDSTDLAYLSPFYLETWNADAIVRRRMATVAHLNKGKAVVEAQQRFVKALHDRGVRLVPGSATPNPWLFPGRALLDELSMWRGAGISIADCVRAATAGACETLGIELRGTIRKAKIADLIAVRSDPTQDLAALYRPEVVVVRGRVLKRSVLDARAEELRAAQSKVREALTRPLEVEPPTMPNGDPILSGYVETRAIGVRISAERFVVARRFDGALVYVGRVRTVGQGALPDTETLVTQVIEDGDLSAFDVSMRTGAKTVEVHGEIAGGRMNVSRKFDGIPVDNVPVQQRLALVDCGSATAWLVLGYHKRPGAFQVAFFENYDPATGPWEMALDPEASTHYLRMLGSQEAIVKYDAFGVPTEVQRQSGNGTSTMVLLESKILDARGLPMSAEKKAEAPQRPPPGAKAGAPDGAKDGAKAGAKAGAKDGAARPAEAGAPEPK